MLSYYLVDCQWSILHIQTNCIIKMRVFYVVFGGDNHKSLECNEKANKALLTRTALNLIRANGDEKLSVKCSKMRTSQNKSYLERLVFGGEL